MICMNCNRNLIRCICEDIDERLANLRTCKYLDTDMLDRIDAERLLAKHEIEADRQRYGDRKPEDPERDYYKEDVERQICDEKRPEK